MDVVSAIGPGSDYLPHQFTNGYAPFGKNGEQTCNAFIDPYAWNQIQGDDARVTRKASPHRGKFEFASNEGYTQMVETDGKTPTPFNEWASVTPGMICLAAKNRASFFRNHVTAETAMPVIAKAYRLCEADNNDYVFAGIARTPSVREYDDGRGPKEDEYFTLTMFGMVEMLNNGDDDIAIGDPVEWTLFANPIPTQSTYGQIKRQRVGPRTIVIRKAVESDARVFGVAKSYARRGERVDVLVQVA